MKAVIRWAITNAPAMNTLMIAGLLLGVFSIFMMRREVFPAFDLEIVLVSVPYPGATAEEVEDGICQKIEEAVRAIDGIKKQTSVAKEGGGFLVLELRTDVDPQKVLAEVRSEIDRIPSFPQLAEDPEVQQITMRQAVIQVGILGPDAHGVNAERELREVAESVRDDLIRLDNVSQANLSGVRDFQLDVEIPEATLRQHGLTLQQVAQIIRAENLEMPGGTIKTPSQDVLIKAENKGIDGKHIAAIPLVTLPGGAKLTVGDLGTVRDEFVDVTSKTLVNDQPAMVVAVEATNTEDLLAMTSDVHEYVKQKELPHGYSLVTWGDQSIDVRDRMNLLGKNGLQGLFLVLLTLAIFLNLRVAFWVALGIPISILGACVVLWYTGNTMNMLTMFAFLMALGIVVDDAIVVGENIYAHEQMGKSRLDAAVDGTYEVLPSVTASVTTTVVAFSPLFFVTGIMGKFIAVMPLAMIAMLVISLLEAATILPCHLAHEPHDRGRRRWPIGIRVLYWAVFPLIWSFKQLAYPFLKLEPLSRWVTEHTNAGLETFAERIYQPALRYLINNPWVAFSGAFSLLLIAAALVAGGHVPFNIFPKLDSKVLEATIVYPDGTPAHVTDKATEILESSIRQIAEKHKAEGNPILNLTRRSVGYTNLQAGPGQTDSSNGGHRGGVTAELLETSERTIKSDQITREWRQLAYELAEGFPGAESVSFQSAAIGPGGTPIEFKLLAPAEKIEQLEAAVEDTKAKLRTYPGAIDVDDDSRAGKWEFHLAVKDKAVAMGVPLADVGQTVRASYYGEEVMRLQRGRHEVRLMVRYPEEDRKSLADLEQIRIRTGDGAERPLTEIASIRPQRGLSEINRVDQLRSITVSSDIDESKGNAREITNALRGIHTMPERIGAWLKGDELPPGGMEEILAKYPDVRVRWEGQQEQTAESLSSLAIGYAIAMVVMFILLTVEFRSYLQPLLILAIIPFGIVGAIGGHALLGMDLTLFSVFGLVALTGVVVNDSIVLIDFVNIKLKEGLLLEEALTEAGTRRLRPVLLTSITTVAGLAPLLTETSFQAQLLIPMAVSLAAGLLVSTTLVLFLLPTMYSFYGRLVDIDHSAARVREPELIEKAKPSQRLPESQREKPETEPKHETVLTN